MLDVTQFKVLSFDCYGTLIDWEQGIVEALRPVVTKHDVEITDDQLLALYARAESGAESTEYQPYRVILQRVMTAVAQELDIALVPGEESTLAESLKDWPPFPDTVAALQRLSKRYKLAIISNIDDDLFAHSREHLKTDFNYIVTATQSRAYKPSHDMFKYALNAIGCPRDEMLHVAQSLFHDHVPAKELGFSTVWINRRKGQSGSGATPDADASPDLEFPDLQSFAEFVEAQFSA